MRLIVRELEQRGVNVRCDDAEEDSDHIAILSEWDTYYGRIMPATFAAALTGGMPASIRRYAYLQGLDGIIPEAESEEVDTKEKEKRSRPEGRSQLDYVRRLAHQLQRERGILQRSQDKDIKAIGVLGSDVYDKLLMLQALRDVYPDVIFFTTDLDARLIQPSEQQWTRNLIVASAYGLQVGAGDRIQLPPFRGSYMAAMYHACRRAVSRSDPADTLRAKVFEIARRQAVSLDERKIRRVPLKLGMPGLSAMLVALLTLMIFLVTRLRGDFA